MTSDRITSLFPERPIRPLPKRKLRERLSPRAIQTIEYPPAALNTASLFCYPAHLTGEPLYDLPTATREHHAQSNETSHGQGPPNFDQREPIPVASTNKTQLQSTPPEDIKYIKPLDQGATFFQNISAASSSDGHDSLENRNNKKKRKIPSASDTTFRGSLVVSTGSVEILELGSGIDDGNQVMTSAFDMSGSMSLHNDRMSGPGRGRLSRTLHMRSPLRTLPDGNNSWPSRSLKTGLHQSGNGYGTRGIISKAIARAERLASSSQENPDSLLRRHSETARTRPIASKFTFTCGPQVTGTAAWHDTLPAAPFTECSRTETLAHAESTPATAISSNKAAGGKRRRPRIKNRSQREKDLLLAAHTRRQAAVNAYHHDPPRLQDIWICEFCEYERIFGRPPKALIREYELRDRRLRQEEADRRRLLEKAKAKSRKGRKANKVNKGTQPGPQGQDQVSEGHIVEEPTFMENSHSHSTQSEVGGEERIDNHRSRDPPDIVRLHENGPSRENFPVP
ncbi:hypothetical protein LLEC1_03585 [Akanthomyces lecanii]|uniref:Uncharacterized protein n=1 Tax=Cordyceps confragosa TaxID=2714763 RepID=A0A179I794_CORDF|nr:hypothetical protein LLEC1_03585 [Akanthomyces lecanii]